MNHIFRLVIFLALFVTLPALPSQAQRTSKQQEQANQRAIDERLANEFYRNKEWEQAKQIYARLYDTYNAQHYYNNYLNCLIQLQDYDEADKLIKKRQKQQKNVQTDVDFGYIQLLRGNTKRANDYFEKMIRQMPAVRNTISSTANAFRIRGLDEFALKAYERGSKMAEVNYGFYLEKSNVYQIMGKFDLTMDHYLLYLQERPEQQDLIKNRIQNMLLMDFDDSMSDMIRGKLLVKAQQQTEHSIYNELLIWFSLQEKDYELAMIQEKALDRRMGDRDLQILELAGISLSNRQYEVAKDGFAYVLKKGSGSPYYVDALKGELLARYTIAEQQYGTDIKVYQQISKDIDRAFEDLGFNRETYELAIIQASILSYQMDKPKEAQSLMEQSLQLPLRPEELANLKLHIADLLLYQNDVWEATLLYSQVDKALKSEPIAHEARFRNARLRYYIGEFAWALAQLDVLKAATSKLISNDALKLSLLIRDNMFDDTTGLSLRAFSKADLMVYQNKGSDALQVLDSLLQFDMNYALRPHVLLTKAKVLQKQADFKTADSLYSQIYEHFPDSYLADDALFQSALLFENEFKNTDEARKRFEAIFTQYPASIYAVQARQKYRSLRGDSF